MTAWSFPRAGKDYSAYARVMVCRACGNPFIPPGYGQCCSVRCVEYMAIAGRPVLCDPMFVARDQPIKCRGCEIVFESRGIRYCPTCFFKARPPEPARQSVIEPQVKTDTTCPVRAKLVSQDQSDAAALGDRDPRTRCHW
jgi:hypothetical protein